MSEQEKKSGGSGVSPTVVVEQTTNSRHKPSYRPTEIQEDSDVIHKHSRAPTVPCVAEELKDLTVETTVKDNVEEKEQNRAKSTEMSKQNVSKKLSSIPKKQSSSPESIALAHLEVDTKKGSNTPPAQPIPQDVEALPGADFTGAEKESHKRGDTDSITEEISEGRTVETSKKYSNWSDDEEEAGGLPRSESRASRVSRVVRQFFCCGVPYEAPSEENISSGRAFGVLIFLQVGDQPSVPCLIDTFYFYYLFPRDTNSGPLELKASCLQLSHRGGIIYQDTTVPLERREISWKEKDFQGREILSEIGAKSRAWILERRASVGPCFRPGMPFEGPTGIAIHIPRKNVSSKSKFNIQREKSKEAMKECNQNEASECESKLISTLKEKLNSVHSKIKNAFHY